MKFYNTFLGLVILIILTISCSGGGVNPLTPSDKLEDISSEKTDEIISVESDSSDHDSIKNQVEVSLIDDTYHALGVFGAYELNLDAKEITAELSSIRTASIGESYIVSGAAFFTMTPCTDCLKIESIELTEENYATLNFNISHPFDKGDPSKPPTARNRLDLDLFDVALVIVPQSANSMIFPLIGVQTYPGLCPLADGYTRELSNLTGITDACPYFLVIDDSSETAFSYNKFEMGTQNRKFSANFADQGTFNLYLTMGYGASARKFTRFTPQYYNPEYNKKPAWKVEVIPPEGNEPPELGNTWNDVDTETEFPIIIKVYDWQQESVVSQNYPDENNRDQIFKSSRVSSVSLEILGMINSMKSVSTPISGNGSPQSPLVYEVNVANENALSAGEYSGIIKVSDERTPASYVLPGAPDALIHSPDGILLDWLAIDEYATYQIFTATVVVGEGITITNPNGGETWIFGEPATIEWTSQGTTTNVNIELSLDGGQNYTIPIANNRPNNGSYTVPMVGEWITENAKIRIYNSMDISIMDASNGDFSIVCPDLDPPSNINASDGEFHDRVRVTWDPYNGATAYNVYRNDTLQIDDFSGTSWDDMNAVPSEVYNYQVQTVKSQCTSARSSNESGYACVLPGVPTNVNASDGDFYDKVTVTWNEVYNADIYTIYRNSSVVESDWTETTWDDTNTTMGIYYTYQIQAVNDCGLSELSDGDQGHACVLPAIPTNVNATDGDYHDLVTVTWNLASGADNYNIYRNSQLRESNWPGTTWDDTTVTPGIDYSYQIQSINDCGTSEYSIADNGFACILPDTPTGLTATKGTRSDHVHLSWNAASLADAYHIYRNNTQIQSYVYSTNWDDYTADGGAIYSYEVEAVNDCGISAARSTPDDGWYPGCPSDSNSTCQTANRIMIEDSISGCVDMIDEDWYWFYVSPNGFTSASEIVLNVNGNVDVWVYGHDPGGSCPGTLLQSWSDVGSGTLNMSSGSTMSRIFIRLKGYSGMVSYTMSNTFIPALTNLPVEFWVATDNGNSSGNWPRNSGGTYLDVALLNQMLQWNNNIWNQYGYNLVWDGTPGFMSSQYYNLSSWNEEEQMRNNNNSGGAKSDLYFVNQLVPPYNTAYCWVRSNQSDHNTNNVYTVYSPNVWYWEMVIAHEYGHAMGYYNDQYLYHSNFSGCPCGNRACLSSWLGYTVYLYDNPHGCYNGNLMWYYVGGPWSDYDLHGGQYNYIHEFHFNNPGNYPWY